MNRFLLKNRLIYTILGSLTSQETYRIALQHGKGVGFMYIFIVIALFNLPTSMILSIERAQLFSPESTNYLSFGADGSVKKNRHAIIQDIAEQLPIVRFENGRIIEPKPQPFIVREPVSNDPLLIIDSSKADILPENPRTLITIGREYMTLNGILEGTPGLVRVPISSPFSGNLTGPIDIKAMIKNHANALDWFKNLYPLKCIEYFVMFALLLPFMACVAMLVGQLYNMRANFSGWMRLSALAATPGIIAAMLMDLPGLNRIFIAQTLITLAIMLYFIICGVLANRYPAGTVADKPLWS